MPSISLGSLASVASIAGTGISALGAISSGNAQAAQAQYQSEVARNNAVIANQNADYAIKSGEQQATIQGLKGRAAAGSLRAAIAANGIDVNSGSAVDLRTSQAEASQLDTETVRQAAALRAYGYRSSSTSFAAESGLDRAAAGFDRTAGIISAGGSLLSGAGSIGLKFSGLQNKPATESNQSDLGF